MKNWIALFENEAEGFHYPNEDAISQSDLHYIYEGVFFCAAKDRPFTLGAAMVASLRGEERERYFNEMVVPLYVEHGLPVPGKPPYGEFQDDLQARWRAKFKKDPKLDYTDHQVVLDILFSTPL